MSAGRLAPNIRCQKSAIAFVYQQTIPTAEITQKMKRSFAIYRATLPLILLSIIIYIL